MDILKIVILIAKIEITIYCNKDFIVKEIRENKVLTNKFNYFLKNDSLIHYNYLLEKKTQIKLNDSDFTENLYTLEGFREIQSKKIKNDKINLEFNSISVERDYLIPNLNSILTTEIIFSDIPIIRKYIANTKYLKILNLTNNSEQYFPFIIQSELNTKSNYGPKITIYKIISINEINVNDNFFE